MLRPAETMPEGGLVADRHVTDHPSWSQPPMKMPSGASQYREHLRIARLPSSNAPLAPLLRREREMQRDIDAQSAQLVAP